MKAELTTVETAKVGVSAELTTVEVAERFVGKRIRYYKDGWRSRPEADALRTRGSFLVIRNAVKAEHGLHVRADDPWIVEEVEET